MDDKSPISPFSTDPVPVFASIFLLILSMLFGMLIGQLASTGIVHLSGIGSDALSNLEWRPRSGYDRNIYRLASLVMHLFTFLIPGLLLSWFLYRRRWLDRLQWNQKPIGWQLFLGAVWIIVAFPVAQYLYIINQAIPLPEWVGRFEETANELIASLLVMESPWEFILSLLTIAVAPALGEELIFRGLIQKQIEVKTHKPHLAVILAALIFSAWHMQFEGFLPRALLGLLLGYLFLWSRNLWIPIFVHFVFNAIQVVAAYVSPELLETAGAEIELDITTFQLVMAFVATFALGYIFWDRSLKSRKNLT